MTPDPLERRNVSLVGYHDLDGRPGFKMALQVVDGRWYLYLAHFWHSGWTILDVTDPADPVHQRFVPGPANTMTLQVQVADGRMLTSLEKPREGLAGPVDGEPMTPAEPYAEGALLWDVTDPTDPERLGHYRTGGDGTHRNHYAGGDYAYVAARYEEFDWWAPAVVDVSDPTDPTEVARWWWPGQHPDDDADGDAAFYFHGPAYVDGDRAYLSYGREGMVILDVADPTDPTFAGRVEFGDLGAWLGVHSAVPLPDTDLVAVNSEALADASPLDDGQPLNYTFLVDVSEVGRSRFEEREHRGPRVVSALPLPTPEDDLPYDNYYEKPGRFGPHNQHHYQDQDAHYRTGDVLPMVYVNAGLRLFDVSDPLAPTEVGHYVSEPPASRAATGRPDSGLVSMFEDVLVDARGYVYCTDPQQGVFVLESPLL